MPTRELSPEERRIRGIKLAHLVRERDRNAALHAEENRAYREEVKDLSREIESLSREVESGFIVEDGQAALFTSSDEPKPPVTTASSPVAQEPATDEPAPPCSLCGATGETVSLEAGGVKTPPLCPSCFEAASNVAASSAANAEPGPPSTASANGFIDLEEEEAPDGER